MKLAFLQKCGGYTSDSYGFLCHAMMVIDIAIQRGNAQIISAATFQWRQTPYLVERIYTFYILYLYVLCINLSEYVGPKNGLFCSLQNSIPDATKVNISFFSKK